MTGRARELAGATVGGIWGGTFHHLANRLLRRHSPAIGFDAGYTILDQDDSLSLLRACVNELGLRDRHFPKAEVLLSLYGLARNSERPIEQVVERHFHAEAVHAEEIPRVCAAYADRKRGMNALDFDDLLVEACRLLRERADVRERYQERFLHVLVDEYQDTNPLQAELVDALAGRHRNLLVVGDDFQSIYSWRGADFQNFLSFPERYPDAQVYKLETNYRSLPGILDVANACIAGNPRQFQKTLRAVREGAVRPVLVELRDGGQQARFVIEEIHRLRREGVPPGEIAVLYRAHFQAMELQLELTREQVPYVITSGVRFFEQAHIKDVCSLLRLAHQPGDEMAFLRLLALLPKIGERTARRIWEQLGGRFSPLRPPDVAAVAERLPAGARDDWQAIAEALTGVGTDDLRRAPGELIERFSAAFYERYAAETFENYERRIEDLDELERYLSRFETLGDFLNEMALMTNLDAQAETVRRAEPDSILLSTVHQAKGLEWSAVFVLWLAEGLFPSGRSLEEQGGDEEERRLFYVAATRAKDSLYLCVPAARRTKDRGWNFYTPSRFVTEIPPKLVRKEPLRYG
jgi:DNA helicase-2/ATP-dependent DNA helicase PcrA